MRVEEHRQQRRSLTRCLQHEELGPSQRLVALSLQRAITRSVRNASHIGRDVAVRATTTATFYGSDVKKDIEDARRWCLAKEKILDDATARAGLKRKELAHPQSHESRASSASRGGVLLNPRDDRRRGRRRVRVVGLSRFKTSSRFTKGRGGHGPDVAGSPGRRRGHPRGFQRIFCILEREVDCCRVLQVVSRRGFRHS